MRSFALIPVFLLAACGGGGGGSDASPPPQAPATTNVEAAVHATLRAPHTYSLHGSASTGQQLTGTLSVAVGPTQTYQGLSFDSSVLNLAVFQGATLQSSQTITIWLQPGTTAFRFSTNSAGGVCTNYTSTSGLPTNATLGASGAYYSGVEYPGCTSPANAGPATSGNVTGTWSYSSVDGTPWVCVNSSTTGAVAGAATSSICAQVTDTNGSLGTKARVVLKDFNNVTITLSS